MVYTDISRSKSSLIYLYFCAWRCSARRIAARGWIERQLSHLPLGVCCLFELKELTAGHNRLTAVPVEICQLQRLEALTLRHNRSVPSPRSAHTPDARASSSTRLSRTCLVTRKMLTRFDDDTDHEEKSPAS